MTRGGVASLAATVVCGLVAQPPVAAEASPVVRVTSSAKVNRVSDAVLRSQRYDYQRRNWRIREAEGLPHWLKLRHGSLTGMAPRLGQWRIVLEERGVRTHRGERRRTVLVLKSVTERAAPGTVLITRGIDGRPANGDTLDAMVSGDGSTVVFTSRATNLVAGETEPDRLRLYAWSRATGQATVLSAAPPQTYVALRGVTTDGGAVLVQRSNGDLDLYAVATGAVTTVALGVPAGRALLTDDGDVLFQDLLGTYGQPAPRILRRAATTGETTVVATVDTAHPWSGGGSADGRRLLLLGRPSGVLDTTSGTFTPASNEHPFDSWSSYDHAELSLDGGLGALRGVGPAAGHGEGGDRLGAVMELPSSRLLGTDLAASITPDGQWFTTSTPTPLALVNRTNGDVVRGISFARAIEVTAAAVSDDSGAVTYVSDSDTLLHDTRRGVANVFLWVRPR